MYVKHIYLFIKITENKSNSEDGMYNTNTLNIVWYLYTEKFISFSAIKMSTYEFRKRHVIHSEQKERSGVSFLLSCNALKSTKHYFFIMNINKNLCFHTNKTCRTDTHDIFNENTFKLILS